MAEVPGFGAGVAARLLLSEDFAKEQEWMWYMECCGLLLLKGDGGNCQVLQQFGVSLQSIT